MIPAPTQAGAGSTAAVLWLMILIVFLPIAAAHGLARYAAPPDPPDPPAVQAAVAGAARPGS